jgi:hypothetical protein
MPNIAFARRPAGTPPFRGLFAALVPLAFAVASCGEVSTLPSAVGGLDEVLFVQDPRLMEDTLYGTVKATLQRQYGRFLHREPTFDLLTLPLEDLANTLQKHRNLLFVGALDATGPYNDQLQALMGQEGTGAVRGGGTFIGERRNVWADGQHVHLIVAPDRERLERVLPRAMDETMARIDGIEAAKVQRFVYASGVDQALTRELAEAHDIVLRIPEYYDRHEASNGNFLWYRRSTLDLTASVMVYHHPYRRETETTPAYAVFVRDSLGRRYERSATPGAYMTTEKLLLPQVDTVDLNGHFAIRTQGLWRLVNDFMGGPFVNYQVYDPVHHRIIHLDAYVYAPDITRKRKLVRELDAILRTFDLPGAVVDGKD